MKTEDITLIEKFLEGSVTESETQTLLHKLEARQIPIDEIQEILKINGILYAEFHDDKNTEKLSDIVNRAISEKRSNLSDRVIRKIERKKQKNHFWAIAAILFLSLLAGYMIISQNKQITQPFLDSWKLTTTNQKNAILVSSNTIKNETVFIQTYELPDGSIIELFPDSYLTREKNLLILEKGKLQANIKKQAIPLYFKSGESNCHIIGTKFILQSYTQQEKPVSELTVSEGIVEMSAFSKKELVKNNQKCLATSYDQKLVLSTLKSSQEIIELTNPNIIYFSHFENQIMDRFWEKWSGTSEHFFSVPNKLTLALKKDEQEVFIQSKIFKTFNKKVIYQLEVKPYIENGSFDLSLIFSSKKAPNHQEGFGFLITKKTDEIIVQPYQIIGHTRKEKVKGTFKKGGTLNFYGNLSHSFTSGEETEILDPKENNKPTFKLTEDITMKLILKQVSEGEGKIEFINAKIERILENPKK